MVPDVGISRPWRGLEWRPGTCGPCWWARQPYRQHGAPDLARSVRRHAPWPAPGTAAARPRCAELCRGAPHRALTPSRPHRWRTPTAPRRNPSPGIQADKTTGPAGHGSPDLLRGRQESPRKAPGHDHRASVNGMTIGHSPWSRSPKTLPGPASAGYASNPGGEAEPNSGWPGSVTCSWVAVLCCCTRCPGFRIMSVTCGAKGTRTPGLLHAISRQHIHSSTYVQVSVSGRAYQSSQIQAGCGTFLLYSPGYPAGVHGCCGTSGHLHSYSGNSGPNSRIDLTLLSMSGRVAYTR